MVVFFEPCLATGRQAVNKERTSWAVVLVAAGEEGAFLECEAVLFRAHVAEADTCGEFAHGEGACGLEFAQHLVLSAGGLGARGHRRWGEGFPVRRQARAVVEIKRATFARRPFLVRDGKSILAFRELEAFAGSGLAGLFPFLHTRIACEEPLLFERDAEGFVNHEKGTAESEAQGAGLTVDAAAGCFDSHVVTVDGVGNLERAEDLILDGEAHEVVGEFAAVDFDGSGSWQESNAGDGGFPASGGLNGFCCAHAVCEGQTVWGFCAVCGCSLPA